jgi:hypothetical protein
MKKPMRIDSTLLSALAKAIVEEASAPHSPSEAAPPIWIRPPLQKEGRCPYTGMRHGGFYQNFADHPRIRQARMGTGKERGTRLFWLPDIYAEIERIADQRSGGDQ